MQHCSIATLQQLAAVRAAAVRPQGLAIGDWGRDGKGGSAIALVEVDGEVPAGVLRAIQALPGVKQAKALKF